MPCHRLRHFELAAVQQVGRDAGCAPGVTAYRRFDADRFRPPPDHPVNVRLRHARSRLLAGLATWYRPKQRPLSVSRNSGSLDIRSHGGIQVVVRRHFVFLPPPFHAAGPTSAARGQVYHTGTVYPAGFRERAGTSSPPGSFRSWRNTACGSEE